MVRSHPKAPTRKKPGPRASQPRLRDISVVEVGDWPNILPVTEQELRVVETMMAEALDEILPPCLDQFFRRRGRAAPRL